MFDQQLAYQISQLIFNNDHASLLASNGICVSRDTICNTEPQIFCFQCTHPFPDILKGLVNMEFEKILAFEIMKHDQSNNGCQFTLKRAQKNGQFNHQQ